MQLKATTDNALVINCQLHGRSRFLTANGFTLSDALQGHILIIRIA